MRTPKGFIEIEMVTCLVIISILGVITPYLFSGLTTPTSAQLAALQIKDLSVAMEYYYKMTCKEGYTQPSLATLINNGLITKKEIENIYDYVNSLDVTYKEYNPTVVIDISTNIDNYKAIESSLPLTKYNSSYFEYQRQIPGVSQSGYGYGQLFNKECGF